MHISQIFITDHHYEELPAYLKMATHSVKSQMPHDHYHCYSKEELRTWILQEYGNSMLKAFDKLIPYAYKADLARYLLLYRLGGWYFDITVRVLNGVGVDDEVDFITFVDLPQYSQVSFACNNAIIYSKANSPILESTIYEVYHNIKNEKYGKNCLAPTGPLCLGKNIAKHFEQLSVVTGSFVALTPEFNNKNRGFVLNDGSILALHKKGNQGGDLTKLGIEGTNNYGELYNQRKIYDPEIILD
ncbi:hypothetical protein B0187_05320 [Haemophilus paracuniculus]|uniref:Glycosyltransferase n=1 Tax=Haemophilus paracuniculus TaxID=734 RepID=A0A1T0ASK5_9PAST|nr:glycosyltransferase [Haemophilus paracuniculus]OOR99178.1 hypothetical protein B0187_05320 [Haemophilus paracuniculus]